MWRDHVEAGVIATCPIVELEFLYSAQSLADRMDKVDMLRETFSRVPMQDKSIGRAREVQLTLTQRGLHRSAGAVDLLIAANAEGHGLTILADDHDYQAIAEVTGQRVALVSDGPLRTTAGSQTAPSPG